MQKTTVLFVCLGNICRSPTAEGVFRRKLIARQLDDQIEIDSAGLGSWHVGKAPDSRAQHAAASRGIDISMLRARQVEAADFERFDLVIAMDHDNQQGLDRIAGSRYADKIHMMMAFSELPGPDEVPDPYYGGEGGFDQVLDLIDAASDGLIDFILGKRHG